MKDEEKCIMCNGVMERKYQAMKEWNIDGSICGKCYSKKISEYYPGKHGRVNLGKN